MGGFKSDIHRLLMNPLYHGEFVWVGKWYQGSHEPLVTRDLFEQVQAVLQRKPRARKPKQRHAFMGLLACASCGCAITAELKKGKYVYYHCTDFKGGCNNTYIRQERLSELLADVIAPIQIPAEIADWLASEMRATDGGAAKHRAEALRQLDQRRRGVLAKMDRGYEDFIEARISEEFWIRKSKQWEDELRVIDAERARAEAPRAPLAVSAEKILELAEQAEDLYKSQDPAEQRRLLETVVSNCTFDRGSVCPTYRSPFDLFVRGNETGEWRGRRDSKSKSNLFVTE